jgi:hypothetical protein
MIRSAEDLPQRALFMPCQKADETKPDQNPSERMAETAITGPLGPMTGRPSLKLEYNGAISSDRP